MRASGVDPGASAAPLRNALAAADSDGRLPPSAAHASRLLLDRAAAKPPGALGDPEPLLGPFETLPLEVRRSLIRALEDDERWRLRGYELGDWHVTSVRSLRSLRARRLSKRASERGALLLRDGPPRTVHALYRACEVWKGRHASRPSIGSLLRAGGLDPRSLAVCYARGLAQPRRYRGFWHDPKRNVTVGSVLGVDLLPSAEGLWYLESNLNPAVRPARAALYAKDDPLVVNLFRFAQERGHRRVVIVLGNNFSIDAVMAERFEKESAARGLELTLLEDAYLRRSRYAQTFGVPESVESDTLVVRMKLYPTNLDQVFHSKRGCHRALGIYQARSADPDVLLPPTSDDPVAAEYDPSRPFPNLVYKMPEQDLGNGVVFLKTPSLESARELVVREIEERGLTKWSDRLGRSRPSDDQRGIFQPYIVGSMLEGRRLYYVRSHVFLTPLGPQFLSAHRIACSHPVPDALRDGVVRDRTPYFWSFDRGATFELPSPEEESAAVRATLAVARGLSAAAAYAFETGPPR